jgi:hypothetical protein
MITALNSLSAAATPRIAAAFEPVNPGLGPEVERLIGYALWIGIVICLFFLAVGIIRLSASIRDGGEIAGAKQMGLAAVSLVLLGSFGALTDLLAVNF